MESLTSSIPAIAFLASVVFFTVLSSATAWVYLDYQAWLAFGTGGTPANFKGYMRISKFRIKRALSGDDLKDASSLSTSSPSYLPTNLPRRHGKPPKIMSRTLPQRQHPDRPALEQKASTRLHELVREYAAKNADVLTLDKSITEGRSTDAIYARAERSVGARDKVLGHEIAHVHPAENSLHVWLTQTDAKKVVEGGWGERFPLASLGIVDAGWTFVYAPRSMEEIDIVETIVKAGIGHLTGKRV